ncbi:MAG: hypothetical protein KJ077_28920 [Anaerolineae bacterium]|nr:hypothetical protein [Anaerolineae bacterium]
MDREQSHLTQAIVTELEDLQKIVSDELAQRSKAKKTLADLVKALAENDTDTAIRLQDQRIRQVADLYPQIKPTLEKLAIDLNRRQDEQLRQTYLQLEEYCQTQGLSIKGRQPKYVVDHFIEVELDQKKGRSKVGIQSLSTLKWASVREALIAERTRLWQRPFQVRQFRDRLVKAYREVEQAGPSPTGWVPLEEIYQILKRQIEQEHPDWRQGGRLVPYYKDEFQVDLSKLWQAQVAQKLDSPHIELSSIRDPRRAYQLLQPDQNIGSYGFLRPQEVK